MTVSVIIVNRDGGDLIVQCLRSVERKLSSEYEIVVVDNGSSDESVKTISKLFPRVRVIMLGRNAGFAAANNIGAASAKSDFFLLLNYDTILLSDLSPALLLMQNQPEVGILGARMVSADGKIRLSTGRFPAFIHAFHLSGLYLPIEVHHSKSSFIVNGWIEGSFMLVRRCLWEQLGGMDDGFFMYFEDVDLCYRAQSEGYLTVYHPSVCYVHYGGYSQDRMAMLKNGLIRYFGKTRPILIMPIIRFLIEIAFLLRRIKYIVVGNRYTRCTS